MAVFKFRILLDTEGDVFRDVEIQSDQTFEELHQSIVRAFGFRGDELASFYLSNDEWDKGQEIALMDMSFGNEAAPYQMSTTILEMLVEAVGQKLVYVYDFMKMWCFYVELTDISKEKPGQQYPRILMSYGEAPNEDDKDIDFQFAAEEEDFSEDLEDEIDDMFDDFDGGFDEGDFGDYDR
jgi:hypothetical protein